MNIYDENGYLNFAKISTINVPFVLIVGARAIGKTYGALRHEIESGEIFALMRRTQNQIDMVRRPEFSPFKPITEDTGIEVWLKPISKNNSAITPEPRKNRSCEVILWRCLRLLISEAFPGRILKH